MFMSLTSAFEDVSFTVDLSLWNWGSNSSTLNLYTKFWNSQLGIYTMSSEQGEQDTHCPSASQVMQELGCRHRNSVRLFITVNMNE